MTFKDMVKCRMFSIFKKAYLCKTGVINGRSLPEICFSHCYCAFIIK